jgi:hypothetical protein
MRLFIRAPGVVPPVKRVTFRVRYPEGLAHPLHRRLGDAEDASRMELLMWGPTGTVTVLLWFDAGREAVSGLLGALDAAGAELVAGDGGTYAFLRQRAYEFDDAVMDLVGDARAVFLPPVVFRAEGDATVAAVGETEGLSGLYERLDDVLDATIARVSEFRRPGGPDTTARQREALRAAVALGYYDVPRAASVADVARELGCAPSTAGELLRRAESAVVRDALAPGGTV